MSSGAVPCGSRKGNTTNSSSSSHTKNKKNNNEHQLQQAASSLCPVASTIGCNQASNWKTVHSGRLDKITGQCLWNACKALIFGVVLLLIGAAMATIGYYSDSLSMMEDEKRGNVTIKVRNVSKQLHTLSYIGPIIMGVGGFVIVAACVMTFEARDSAAKIVPARFRTKVNQPRLIDGEESVGGQELCVLTANGTASTHLVTSVLGASWEHRVQRLSGGGGGRELIDRLALTTAFIEFSQNIEKSIDSDHWLQNGAILKQRCPSAPDLMPDQLIDCDWHSNYPPEVTGIHIFATDCRLACGQETNVKRLQVSLLPRQAISVDNPGEGRSSSFTGHFERMKSEGEKLAAGSSADDIHKTNSELSMTMDLHLPDCPGVTLTVKDESKRSGDATSASSTGSSSQSSSSSSVGTSPRIGNRVSEVGRKESAKRHPLLRQRPVERHPDSDTEEENEEEIGGTGGGNGGQAS